MAATELREITRNISSEMGGVVGNLRKTASDHQKMFSSILKDIGAHFKAQSKEMENVSSAVEESSNKVASKVDSTNNLLQDQISMLSNVYSELKSLNGNITTLNDNTKTNNTSLLSGILGGFRGLQNVIIGGLSTVAKGGALLGAGALGGMLPSSSGGGAGGKIESNEFYKSIIDAEGTGKHGDPYNTSLGYVTPPKPLTEMTMDESLAWGDYIRTQTPTGIKTNSSAKGAFQIVNTTQKDAMAALGLKGSDKFNEENQKKMASWIAHKQGLGAWEGLKIHQDKMATAQAALQSGVDKQISSGSSNQQTTTPTSKTDATPTSKPEPMAPGSAEHAEGSQEGHGGHEGIISGNTKNKPADAGKVTQSQSGIRSMPINDRLMGVLEKAAAEAGVAVNITSGAQPNFPQGPRTGSTRHDIGVGAADLDLMQNGRVLSDNNPEDIKIKKKFVEAAASAGATGIGAGEGYMGPTKIHVGFGNPATWGGAGWLSGLNLKGGATSGESEQSKSGATPISGGSAVTPAMSGSTSDNTISQINENIQKLGGGVPGEYKPETPNLGMGIPAHGLAAPLNIDEFMKVANSDIRQMQSNIATPNLAVPAAAMVTAPETSRASQAIHQSQIDDQAENYAYRENMRSFNEQTKKQTTEIAASEKTTGTPVIYDYNNASDVGWPDWASMVGGNHWAELKKIKLNMFGG
jgi:hypothetical protein